MEAVTAQPLSSGHSIETSIPCLRQTIWETFASHLCLCSFKAHSHDAIFSECDCVFIHRMEWVVWMPMTLFTLSDCDFIKICSRTQKKSHRVNRPSNDRRTILAFPTHPKLAPPIVLQDFYGILKLFFFFTEFQNPAKMLKSIKIQ